MKVAMTKMNKYLFYLWFFAFALAMASCGEEEGPDMPDGGNETNSSLIEGEVSVITNSSRVAPLTASLDFITNRDVSVELRVIGKNGPTSDIIAEFDEITNDFSLTVLGLYASHDNEVELSFKNASGSIVGKDTVNIQTNSLLSDLPSVEIVEANQEDMVPGLTLVNYFGHNGRSFPQRPFMFDAFGDIRWYLDFSSSGAFSNLFFDAGMIRLENGNLAFGNVNGNAVYEVDILGNIVNQWSLNGNRFHHAVSEKPNGNILATLTDPRVSTVEDLIVEFDRGQNQIVNSWDLRQSLDMTRRSFETDLADTNVDWIHCNGVVYDPSDNSIIVSGRTQATVKLSENNEVVWLIAPHKGWERSGRNEDLNQYLLQPLDAGGNPITDPEVLSGDKDHPDFEWAYGQHSPSLLDNGNVMVFDNGDFRNFKFTGFVNSNAYSRSVEYKIDEENMTIQQVWSYGKELGSDTYSRIVSRTDYYPEEDNVIFAPGSLSSNNRNFGKVIEVDKSSRDVLFDANIYPPRAVFGITFHSVYRMELYHE